jgi:integrase
VLCGISRAWLVERYRETATWTHLSLATRRQRENILRLVPEKAGNQLASKITRAHIVEGRDRRTQSQGRHFDTMRGLFEWAAEAQHVKTDPTAGVKYPKQPTTFGFVKPNAAYRSREHLTEREVERLVETAKDNRWGQRDAAVLVDLRWEQADLEKCHPARPQSQTRHSTTTPC